jgi:hypothetical protein
MMRDPKAIIFSDSDGVICDFAAGAQAILGRPFNQGGISRGADGAQLNAVGHFWETLPPMADLHTYWDFIKKYDPHILTAVPSSPWHFEWQDVDRGKRKWYMLNLPTIPQRNIHIVKREHKRDFARDAKVRNILIDDHQNNIKEFEAAGGIGIWHVSAKSTIIQLKALGYH